MSKYDPLTEHLMRRGQARIPMRFSEIEAVLGFQLPSSKSYRAWWSNNPSNNVMTKAWLAAGYRTEQVDLEGERVVFAKQDKDEASKKEPTGRPKGRHPAWGALKGTTIIRPGTDLTEPAEPEWGEVYGN